VSAAVFQKFGLTFKQQQCWQKEKQKVKTKSANQIQEQFYVSDYCSSKNNHTVQ
jgi:hypothetical protein